MRLSEDFGSDRSSKRAPVTQTGHKLVYAIGLFEAGKSMGVAISQLVEAGVGACQISRVSQRGSVPLVAAHVATAEVETPDEGVLSDVVDGFLSLPAEQAYAGALSLLQATNGYTEGNTRFCPAAATLFADVTVASELGAHVSNHMLDKQAIRLQDHLRAGGDVLVVKVTSDAQQRDVCSTLLAHARRGVQTHEIGRLC